MLQAISTYTKSLIHFIFPHQCEGCGTDILNEKDLLCTKCLHQLPATNFFLLPNNPVEKIFYGRTAIEHAAAAYYFTKESLLQHLLIQLKYRNNKNAGIALGNQVGFLLNKANRFATIDVLVPLPLNPKKESKRGYNQATAICEGITTIFNKPIILNAVERILFTETQTKQDRTHRWQNMQHVFAVKNRTAIEGKHILLVDDVVTTGATLEACAAVMNELPNTKVSIATVAYTI
jgi:ComF family protein